MPRQPRMDLPHVPQHVIQRGNNRQACFLKEQDYLRYLDDLRRASSRSDVAIHAYVLMTNHVHLLVSPQTVGSIGRMMQALGRCYVAYFNAAYFRSGTLWEGRYKACLVDSERYFLACQRYIEMNPVRAAMVVEPADYRWSSYRANALGDTDQLVRPHMEYLSLGAREEERRQAYRSLFGDAVEDTLIEEIRAYTQQQKALGTRRFQMQIEAELQRVAVLRTRGRPSKGAENDSDPEVSPRFPRRFADNFRQFA